MDLLRLIVMTSQWCHSFGIISSCSFGPKRSLNVPFPLKLYHWNIDTIPANKRCSIELLDAVAEVNVFSIVSSS